MRIEGTLTKWNDDRGFGFITPTQGGADIFVHVSAFPNDGRRPAIGERLSFEIETDSAGKKRAKNLLCPTRIATARTPQPSSPLPHRRERPGFFKRMAPAVLIAAGVYGYAKYSEQPAPQTAVASQPVYSSQPVERATAPSFSCDGRIHCSQMTSCAEAEFFLRNCPGVKMDGDHDGIPCEEQLCGN